MTTTIEPKNDLKCAISVKDMAAMCGLSRQRFAQLVKAGVFPAPLYDTATRRPFYPEDAQHVCLEVRRRNFGINGKAVLFYAARSSSMPTSPRSGKEKCDRHPEIIDGLKALGLSNVTNTQVAEALNELYPSGMANIDPSEVIRAVFIHLRRKNAGVNVISK